MNEELIGHAVRPTPPWLRSRQRRTKSATRNWMFLSIVSAALLLACASIMTGCGAHLNVATAANLHVQKSTHFVPKLDLQYWEFQPLPSSGSSTTKTSARTPTSRTSSSTSKASSVPPRVQEPRK